MRNRNFQRMCRNVFWGLVWAVVFLPAAGAASTPPASVLTQGAEKEVLIDRLIKLSGLEQMLDKHEKQLVLGDLSQSGLPPWQAATIGNIMKRIYTPGEMKKIQRRNLRAQFKPKAVQFLLNWYATPLGKRIVDLELQSLRPEAAQGFGLFMKGTKKVPPTPRRIDLTEKLEIAAQLTQNSLQRFLVFVPMVAVATGESDYKIVRRDMKAKIEEIREPLREKLLWQLLYLYRELGEEEIARYTEFVRSSEYQWFYRMHWNSGAEVLERMATDGANLFAKVKEEIDEGKGEYELIKQIFPPGERYSLILKRDVFMPLLDPKKGVMTAEPRAEVKQPPDPEARLRKLPPIPLEVLKRIQRDDPKLYQDLARFAQMFRTREEIQDMGIEELEQTVNNYAAMWERALEVRKHLLLTPLQTDFANLKLVGVVSKGVEKVGLLQTSDRKGHSVRTGALIGPNFGVVDEVNDETVVVLEQSKDYLGNILSRVEKIEFIQEPAQSGG